MLSIAAVLAARRPGTGGRDIGITTMMRTARSRMGEEKHLPVNGAPPATRLGKAEKADSFVDIDPRLRHLTIQRVTVRSTVQRRLGS